MAMNPPTASGAGDDAGGGLRASTPAAPPRTPRWVLVLGAIVAILVLLLVGVMLFGGGEHGPSRHAPAEQVGQQGPGDAARGHDPSGRERL